eukprot:GHVL01015709.1.p1 GENE.GHVL01015709.1~~GHVL01015709.1.p1  ORF type:complete len:541 (+),score=117.28 GHVL01015709.1:148-1770(+)
MNNFFTSCLLGVFAQFLVSADYIRNPASAVDCTINMQDKRWNLCPLAQHIGDFQVCEPRNGQPHCYHIGLLKPSTYNCPSQTPGAFGIIESHMIDSQGSVCRPIAMSNYDLQVIGNDLKLSYPSHCSTQRAEINIKCANTYDIKIIKSITACAPIINIYSISGCPVSKPWSNKIGDVFKKDIKISNMLPEFIFGLNPFNSGKPTKPINNTINSDINNGINNDKYNPIYNEMPILIIEEETKDGNIIDNIMSFSDGPLTDEQMKKILQGAEMDKVLDDIFMDDLNINRNNVMNMPNFGNPHLPDLRTPQIPQVAPLTPQLTAPRFSKVRSDDGTCTPGHRWDARTEMCILASVKAYSPQFFGLPVVSWIGLFFVILIIYCFAKLVLDPERCSKFDEGGDGYISTIRRVYYSTLNNIKKSARNLQQSEPFLDHEQGTPIAKTPSPSASPSRIEFTTFTPPSTFSGPQIATSYGSIDHLNKFQEKNKSSESTPKSYERAQTQNVNESPQPSRQENVQTSNCQIFDIAETGHYDDQIDWQAVLE